MKVKCTIIYEMEDDIDIEERREENPNITLEEIKKSYSEHIFEEYYGRMETRARNVLLSGYKSSCFIEFEDKTKINCSTE